MDSVMAGAAGDFILTGELTGVLEDITGDTGMATTGDTTEAMAMDTELVMLLANAIQTEMCIITAVQE